MQCVEQGQHSAGGEIVDPTTTEDSQMHRELESQQKESQVQELQVVMEDEGNLRDQESPSSLQEPEVAPPLDDNDAATFSNRPFWNGQHSVGGEIVDPTTTEEFSQIVFGSDADSVESQKSEIFEQE
jgi:hypothetical protein